MRLCCFSESVAAPRLIYFSAFFCGLKIQARLLRGGGGYGPCARPRLPLVSQCRLLNGADLVKILGLNNDKTNVSNLLATRFCVFSPFLENNKQVKIKLTKITIEQETLASTFVAAWVNNHKAPNIALMATHWLRSTPSTKTSALDPVRPSSFCGSKNRVVT